MYNETVGGATFLMDKRNFYRKRFYLAFAPIGGVSLILKGIEEGGMQRFRSEFLLCTEFFNSGGGRSPLPLKERMNPDS